jgi:hypothetical protein
MTRSAVDLVAEVQRELALDKDANRLIPLVAAGQAPIGVLGALAAEQHRIISSDWRTFLTLAAQSTIPQARGFFTALAGGEELALAKVADFATACGFDRAAVEAYQPLPGCQAYPAYLAWLALNGRPLDALLAILVNFSAWGDYCGTIAKALRENYGFDDAGCGFFDFFATPVPELEQQAVAALQAGLDQGWQPDEAIGYGRLLQGYEVMFWNSLADQVR